MDSPLRLSIKLQLPLLSLYTFTYPVALLKLVAETAKNVPLPDNDKLEP